MNSIAQLALVVFCTVGCCILAWRLSDPDPKSLRASLSPQEIRASKRRMQWAESVLATMASSANLAKPPSFGIANCGAHYRPLGHRVCVSQAFLARLSDAELPLILAHEIGHAARRWRTFLPI